MGVLRTVRPALSITLTRQVPTWTKASLAPLATHAPLARTRRADSPWPRTVMTWVARPAFGTVGVAHTGNAMVAAAGDACLVSPTWVARTTHVPAECRVMTPRATVHTFAVRAVTVLAAGLVDLTV